MAEGGEYYAGDGVMVSSGGGEGAAGEGEGAGGSVAGDAAGHMRPWNIRACIEAATAFVDAQQGGEERSMAALNLLSGAWAYTRPLLSST